MLSIIPFLLSKLYLLLYKLLESIVALPHSKYGGDFYTMANKLSALGEKGYLSLIKWYKAWNKVERIHIRAAILTYITLIVFINVLPAMTSAKNSPLNIGGNIYLQNESAFINWIEKKGLYTSKEKMIQEAIYLQINNTNTLQKGVVVGYDLVPIMINQRVYMSVRDLFDSLGGKIEWDSITGNILISFQNNSVRLDASKGIIEINGIEQEFIDKPIEFDNRIYVCVSEIMQLLGYQVEWYESYSIVVISGTVPVDSNETLMSEINEILK